VIERDPTLALSGPLLDPGDIAAYGLSRNTVRNSCARTALSRSSTFQTARASWTLRRQVVADAAAGVGEVARAEAHSQAITRRSGRPRLRPLLQSRCGLRSAARQQEEKTRGRGAFVPLAFLPRKAFQFDWSDETSRRLGANCRSLTSSAPAIGPSFSGPIRSRPMRCCSTPTHKFRALGGVPRGGNLRQYANRRRQLGRGKERQVNARFLGMVSHSLLEAEFC
jgi:hypothetical protein